MIIERINIVKTKCPCCDKINEVRLNKDQFKQYEDWKLGIGRIQDIKGLTPTDRELLLTGLCDDCWCEIFKDYILNGGGE